jgi:hypothetical protein
MFENYKDVRLCREFTKGNVLIREYLAWENDNPSDRFQVFLSNGKWYAWTGDTLSASTAGKRKSFAESLNQ